VSVVVSLLDSLQFVIRSRIAMQRLSLPESWYRGFIEVSSTVE